MLSRMKFEIEPLVAEMLDQLPISVWTSKTSTFFDPAIGGGQFVRAIEQRLRGAGHSDANIRSRVMGFEESDLHIRFAVNKYKLVGQYVRKPYEKFFELDNTMKFDVVVGNPPYLKGKWIEFLKQGAELSKKHVLMVSPDGTNNFSTRSDNLVEFLKEKGIQSKKECTSFFPNVESGSIVIYKLDVTQPFTQTAFVDTSMEGVITAKVIGAVGTKLNAILSSKRSKEWSSVPKFEKKAAGLIKNIESVTKEGSVELWIDPTNTTVINGKDYWLVNRYFGKDADTSVIEESSKIGISSNIMAIERINGWTVDEFKDVYLSKLFRFVLNVLRQGGFDTSPRHLKQLVEIKKTGKALYKHFGLTQDEIDYVEANTK
jgi:hypothetical protein